MASSQEEIQKHRATNVSKGAMRKGDHSRVSSRFSQEACEELDKVAERINQSMELDMTKNSLGGDEVAPLEELEEEEFDKEMAENS